jgi:hypothetical protein
MGNESSDPTGDALSYDILTGMREWRLQHPNATLREIEVALDERWYRVRARMLQDLALQSQAAQWQASLPTARPTCPDCGGPLTSRGQQPRHLKTHGDQNVRLMRSYGYCPLCQKGFFPPR